MAPTQHIKWIISAVLSLAIAAWSATGLAGTGTITTSTPHLVGANGQILTGSISWSTQGESTAQVYVSVNGGADKPEAGGPNGSATPNWIKVPNDYVFKLYEGTAHTKLLAYTSISTQIASAEQFGFDYFPAGLDSRFLMNADPVLTANNPSATWANSVQPEVAADISQMAAMGVKVLRLYMLSNDCEFIPPNAHEDTQCGVPVQGTTNFPITSNGVLTNLTGPNGFLSMLQAHGIRTIILFANPYNNDEGRGGDFTNCSCWEEYYPNFNSYLNDAATWMNYIVDAVESSPYATDVIYYDYASEFDLSASIEEAAYLQGVYDRSLVPMGKRGVSVSVNTGTQNYGDLKNSLGSRHLDYIDTHNYRLTNDVSHDLSLLTSEHNVAVSTFPDSTMLLGETGYCSAYDYAAGGVRNDSGESSQQGVDLAAFQAAAAAGFSYYLNWQLYDNTPPVPAAGCAVGGITLGFEYYPNNPNAFTSQAKDIVGGMASTYSLVPNADMETVTNGTTPDNWYAGSAAAFTFQASGPARDAAATNNYYAFVSAAAPAVGNVVWLNSVAFPVQGGQPIYMDAFLNSNLQGVTLSLREYDGNNNLITTDTGPSYTPTDSVWHSYLQEVIPGTPWSVTLNANTVKAILVIAGQAQSTDPAYLAVDTVSVSQ